MVNVRPGQEFRHFFGSRYDFTPEVQELAENFGFFFNPRARIFICGISEFMVIIASKSHVAWTNPVTQYKQFCLSTSLANRATAKKP